MFRAFVTLLTLSFVFSAFGTLAVAQSTSRSGAGKRGATAKSGKKTKPASTVASFESRRADWIRKKEAANASGATGPDPLEQYLVSEVLVTGLFETDSGFGVFLLATPTNNTFFATNGAKLFNGRLVSIEKTSTGFGDDAQVIFEERSGKGSPSRVVKRVVPAPSKPEPVEPAPKSDDEEAPEKKPDETPPLTAH